MFCVLVWDTSQKQWKTLQQQGDHERMALTGSIRQAGGTVRGGGRAGGRLKPEVKVTIGGDRPPRLGGDVDTIEDMRECLLGVRAAGAYHKPRWSRPGTGKEARAGKFGDPEWWLMSSTMASPRSTTPRRSYCKGSKGLLSLICSRRVMTIFAARYPDGCERAGR